MENEDEDEELEQILQNIYDKVEPSGSETNQSTESIIRVLRIVRGCFINDEHFAKSKLSAILVRQLDESVVIAGRVLPK